MSVPLVVNGVTFNYPVQGDTNWGPVLTAWSTAVTNALSVISGGNASFLTITSLNSNPATAGFLRLTNTDAIEWRNFTNTGNLALAVNAGNQLTFNGVPIGASASLTNTHIFVGNVSNQPADVAMSGDTTITNTGVVTIANSAITDVKISATANITLSKLAPTTAYYWYVANAAGVLTPIIVTAGRAVITDANGLPAVLATTSTEVGYLNLVTSAIQPQIDSKLAKSGDTMSGTLNMGSNKIISLANGTNAGDATNFSQLKVIQFVFASTLTQTTTTSSTAVDTALAATITPHSATNHIIALCSGGMQSSGTATTARLHLRTPNAGTPGVKLASSNTGSRVPTSFVYDDGAVGVTTPYTMTVQISSSNNTDSVTFLTGAGELGSLILVEVVP